MLKRYVPWLAAIMLYAVALLGIGLALAHVQGMVSGHADYLRTASDVLFFEGAVALALGAFLELLLKGHSPAVARSLTQPCEASLRRMELYEKDADAAQKPGEGSGGWMLILIGALVIVFSALFALISMK